MEVMMEFSSILNPWFISLAYPYHFLAAKCNIFWPGKLKRKARGNIFIIASEDSDGV
jgi:hypothetical protein